MSLHFGHLELPAIVSPVHHEVQIAVEPSCSSSLRKWWHACFSACLPRKAKPAEVIVSAKADPSKGPVSPFKLGAPECFPNGCANPVGKR